MTEAIPAAMVRAHGVIDQWQRSVTFMLEDVARQVEEMRELTTPERKAFEGEIAREAETSAVPARLPLYSFVNALTATAKQSSPARRIDLESLAGDILYRHVGRGS